MSDEEVRQLIKEVDTNKDGKIDYGEFLDMMSAKFPNKLK